MGTRKDAVVRAGVPAQIAHAGPIEHVPYTTDRVAADDSFQETTSAEHSARGRQAGIGPPQWRFETFAATLL
jgi:hypothetical protein